MGIKKADQFSLLHFATGVIAYNWGLSFTAWFVLHFLFELIENTHTGMNLINKVTMWPGGKGSGDSMVNIVGDQVFASVGWMVAYMVDTSDDGIRGRII